VFDAPDAPLTDIPTVVVPLTVAPAAGLVNVAVMPGGGGEVAFDTVTVSAALAEPPVLVVTVSVSVCGPFGTVVVSHVHQSVLPVAIDWLKRTVDPIESVNVFGVPHGAVVAMPTDCEPPTVAPSAGYWKEAVKGVDDDAFETVTPRVAVAVLPPESVTRRVSVCVPLATVVVFQAYEAVVPVTVCVETVVPSTMSVKVLVLPAGAFVDIPTVVVPLTVAPSAGLVKDAVSVPDCTVTVTNGGLGSLAPSSSTTVSEAVYVPGLAKRTAPGLATVLPVGLPPGKIQR
jgi:hypothetical protein